MSTSHFDKSAADWDKKKRRVELANSVADQLMKLPLESESKAMEFGCGTGLVGLTLAPTLGELTMVDISPGMIETLNQKIAETSITNVETICKDITKDPLETQFDFIFSAMTLHHLEDIDKTLTTLCHHLKKNGILAIADLDEEDGSFHEHLKGEFTHNGFNREALKEKLGALGINDVTFKTVHTIIRKDKNGVEQPFTVFLLNGKKHSQPQRFFSLRQTGKS